MVGGRTVSASNAYRFGGIHIYISGLIYRTCVRSKFGEELIVASYWPSDKMEIIIATRCQSTVGGAVGAQRRKMSTGKFLSEIGSNRLMEIEAGRFRWCDAIWILLGRVGDCVSFQDDIYFDWGCCELHEPCMGMDLGELTTVENQQAFFQTFFIRN